MSYSVTVYKNTGFNASNIPDSPALLEQATKITALPTLEILQDSGLSEVYLKLPKSTVDGADYIRVGDWYYIVVGPPMMTSADVAKLNLIPDYVTSAGGAGNLDYTDGITERVCVPTSSDTFGAYTEPDELTAPSQALELKTSLATYSNVAERTFIESTLDLYEGSNSNEGITYEDPATNETCTVPYMPTIQQQTTHKYGGQKGTLTYGVSGDTLEGIKRARGLGVESGIIAQYNVPNVFIDDTTVMNGHSEYLVMDGKELSFTPSGLPWEQSVVKNKRCLYGEYVKYGLITMAGNKAEFKAEDIYESNTTTPTVLCKADIRSDGCPYWRFKTFLGDDSANGFWRNCLAGARWENVPLVYSEKAGNLLDRQQYDVTREIASERRGREVARAGFDTARNVMRGIGWGARTGSEFGPVGALGGAITGGVMSGIDSGLNLYDQYKTYHEQGELEAMQFGQSQVVAPELNFPFNTDIMRDALKNTIIAYRYYYTNADIARIDKLLTMYGYKHTKALESTDFTNRPKFNFVKTRGGVTSTSSSVLGRLPKWWNDGISAQLSAGVRVWHIMPTVTAYSDNS